MKHARHRRPLWVLGAATAVLLPLATITPANAETLPSAARTVVIDGSTRYQRIDGFGISQAFGTANQIRYLGDVPARKQALDMLFDKTTGAGFSILRNLIPSDAAHTMVPTAPASPTEPPNFVWDGTDDYTDWGQLWISKQARTYGVTQFYNDAWSAPGYMKTNGSDNNGGMLCGTPGTECATGDWRQAYADYLVQHAKNWASVGLTPTALGFLNEPNWVVGYASMQWTPAQTADFLKVLGPTVRKARLKTKLTCCEPVGWHQLPDYTKAILADPAARRAIDIFTSHGYGSAPDSAIDTGRKPVWQTEWSTGQGAFNPAWDDNSTQSGFTWAQHIHDGLAKANLSAFIHWYGVSTSTGSNAALVQLSGTTLNPAKRYYAFVNYSRYIRPGAVRIGATSRDAGLEVTAFRNPDGSTAIVALNTATTPSPVTYRLSCIESRHASVASYLTNNTNDTAAQAPIRLRGNKFTATVPPRSLVTYVIPAERHR
jgi:glucuronoarabinoxylan endo-1,4-beta-xylanase